MHIEYCTACGFCEKTGYCKFKDEMTPMYEMFDKAKGVVVVSPVNFDCITAKLKTLGMQRVHPFRCKGTTN